MQMKQCKRSLSLLVVSVLLAATALFATGCNSNTRADGESTAASQSEAASSEAAVSEAATADTAAPAEATVLGEGETAFTFTVVDGDGNQTVYEIHTDKQTVGDALTELGLIEGEDSEYGLYVKTVNGITVDYDTDGKYWAFYANGEYAQTGVDGTEIEAGASYAFQVE